MKYITDNIMDTHTERFDNQEQLKSIQDIIRTNFFVQRRVGGELERVVAFTEHRETAFEKVIVLTAIIIDYVAYQNGLDPLEIAKNLEFHLKRDDFTDYELDINEHRGNYSDHSDDPSEPSLIRIPARMTESITAEDDQFIPVFMMVMAHELEHRAQYLRGDFRNFPLQMRFGSRSFHQLARYDTSSIDFKDPETNRLYHEVIMYWGYYLYFNSIAEIGANYRMIEFIDYLVNNYEEIFGRNSRTMKFPTTLPSLLFERKADIEEMLVEGRSLKLLSEAMSEFLNKIYYFGYSLDYQDNDLISLETLKKSLTEPINPSLDNVPIEDRQKILDFAYSIERILSLSGVTT